MYPPFPKSRSGTSILQSRSGISMENIAFDFVGAMRELCGNYAVQSVKRWYCFLHVHGGFHGGSLQRHRPGAGDSWQVALLCSSLTPAWGWRLLAARTSPISALDGVRSLVPCCSWKPHHCVQVDSNRTTVPSGGGGCWPFVLYKSCLTNLFFKAVLASRHVRKPFWHININIIIIH